MRRPAEGREGAGEGGRQAAGWLAAPAAGANPVRSLPLAAALSLAGSGGGRVSGAGNSRLFKILLEPFLIPPCAGEGRARAGGGGGRRSRSRRGGGRKEEGAARQGLRLSITARGAWPPARPSNGVCVWRRLHGDGAVPGEAVMG